MQAGEFDAAIAEFDKVGKDSPLYSQALEKRAEVISRKVNLDRAVNFKSAENLYSLIASVEKNYVSRGGKGHLEPNYAPNTRYLLKRCKEFKDRYPRQRPRLGDRDDRVPLLGHRLALQSRPPRRTPGPR